jgi:hypothetical protein
MLCSVQAGFTGIGFCAAYKGLQQVVDLMSHGI